MTITTTQLRRKVSLANNASKEDIVVTKRGKPFVVIMDDKRYEELIANQWARDEKREKSDFRERKQK